MGGGVGVCGVLRPGLKRQAVRRTLEAEGWHKVILPCWRVIFCNGGVAAIVPALRDGRNWWGAFPGFHPGLFSFPPYGRGFGGGWNLGSLQGFSVRTRQLSSEVVRKAAIPGCASRRRKPARVVVQLPMRSQMTLGGLPRRTLSSEKSESFETIANPFRLAYCQTASSGTPIRPQLPT